MGYGFDVLRLCWRSRLLIAPASWLAGVLVFMSQSIWAATSNSPQLVIPIGHSGTINVIDVSHDGRYAVTGGADHTVILWDLTSHNVIKRYTGFDTEVLSVAISHDNQLIAVGTKRRNAHLLNAATGEILKEFETGYDTSDVDFSPDGQIMAAASTIYVHLFDTSSLKEIKKVKAGKDSLLTTDYVENVVFSSNSTFAADTNKGVRVFNLRGRKQADFKFDGLGAYRLAVSPDGRLLAATGIKSRQLLVWDMQSQRELLRKNEGSFYIHEVAFSRDSQHLAYTAGGRVGNGVKNRFRVIDVRSGRQVLAMDGDGGAVRQGAFTGQEVLTVGFGKTYQRYHLASGKALPQPALAFDGEQLMALEGFKQEDAFVVGGRQGMLVKWSLNPLEPQFVVSDTDHLISALGVDETRNQLFVASMDGGLRRYNATSGEAYDIVSGFAASTGTGTILYQEERLMSFARAGSERLVPEAVSTLAVNPQTGNVLTGSYIGEIAELRPPRYQKQVLRAGNRQLARNGFSGGLEIRAPQVRAIDFMLNGNGFAIASGKEGEAVAVNGQQLPSGASTIINRSGRVVSAPISGAVAMAPDARYLWYSRGRRVYRWDIDAGRASELPYLISADQVLDIELSADGTKLASVGRDNTLRFRNTRPKQPLAALTGHQANVNAVSFINNDTQLVTGSGDYTARVWDYETQRELAALIAFPDGAWVAITPDGYFHGTRDVARRLQYSVGLGRYSFDQFDLRYNRPDIVLARLGRASPDLVRAYRRAYEKRLEKMGLPDSQRRAFLAGNFGSTASAPEVNFDAAMPRASTTRQKQFDLVFKASDPGGEPIQRAFVSVNGVNVNLPGLLPPQNAGQMTFDVQLPLSNGENTIEVSVTNARGVASLVESITVRYNGRPSPPALHVVALGVSKYQDARFNLELAAKDATDLAAFFKDRGDYGQISTHVLTDEEVTRDSVMALQRELKKTRVDDAVVVFFAGHGVLDNNLDYYLATNDINFSNPASRGLAYEDLETLLTDIPARNKLLLIDACHSGEVDKSSLQLADMTSINTLPGVEYRGIAIDAASQAQVGLDSSFELMKDLFTDLRLGSGATVISAAAGGEFSFESDEWNNGVFTYSLLEGLSENRADKDGDRQIQTLELQEYVGNRVSELTEGLQNPTMRRENYKQAFPLLLAR